MVRRYLVELIIYTRSTQIQYYQLLLLLQKGNILCIQKYSYLFLFFFVKMLTSITYSMARDVNELVPIIQADSPSCLADFLCEFEDFWLTYQVQVEDTKYQ